MIFHRLHHQLIAVITGSMVIFIITTGLILHWSIRQSLEKALGEKLQAVAVTLAAGYTHEEISLMIQSGGPRLREYFMQPVNQMLKTTELKRIYFFTLDHRSLLDTDSTVLSNQTYYHLQSFPDEMEHLRSGEASYTVLFTGISGEPTMSGFAPLKAGSSVMAGIGVDGNAHFLNTIRRFNHQIIIFGALAAFMSVLLSIVLARSVTGPVAGLAHVSQQIGEGHYNTPIPQTGTSEIGQLAKTMESMRQNVIRREKELKAMVAAVAHEIRNPLGGIELFTGLLADEIGNAGPAGTHLKRIRSEIRYLNDIVSRFLDYARPEVARPESCHFQEIMEDVKENLSVELTSVDIGLSITYNHEPLTIKADPAHIRRILLNLIQNSMHAIRNSGRIEIDSKADGTHVKIRIRDTGSGIPGDIRENIFEPFFTTREKGTGLGLAIVRQLTEANGGTIRLIRSDSDGTVFELSFPRIQQSGRISD